MKWPKDFKMTSIHDPSGRRPVLSSSFSATWEYEVDAVIRALRIGQEFMRMSVSPLPRCRSLVTQRREG